MSRSFLRIVPAARAAFVALALSATALAAAPAQAQSQPSFSFNLQIPGSGQGGGGSVQFGFGNQPQHQGGGWHNPGRPGGGWHGGHGGHWNQRCLTDREVRDGIARYGYRNVEVRRNLGRNRVEVSAVQQGWLYSMRVDKCTGQVDQVQRLRRVQGGGYGGGWHGGGNWHWR